MRLCSSQEFCGAGKGNDPEICGNCAHLYKETDVHVVPVAVGNLAMATHYEVRTKREDKLLFTDHGSMTMAMIWAIGNNFNVITK